MNARTDRLQQTPLHVASENGHLHVVRYLVEHEVEIDTCDFFQQTPLYIAASYNHLDVAIYLLEKNAKIDAPTRAGETPLHYAAQGGRLNIVQFLVEHGAHVDAQNLKGETPLHCAAAFDHIDVVKYLIQRGADLEAQTQDTKTPLSVAASYDQIIAHHGELSAIRLAYKIEKHRLDKGKMVSWLLYRYAFVGPKEMNLMDEHFSQQYSAWLSKRRSILIEWLQERFPVDLAKLLADFLTPNYNA